ncbi:MAG: deoxyuridine 5'-triphosphate nucleotidohydrolase [Candidatus Heimdallarchaeota archaeon]|nr:deoxyuridine 5'-triphosphate nucleotidohydrolase [Candidatus Heimdallarchaeota archaeon]MCK5048879.1 deoxyuridine 5'-triphosphate nucleotidohydrolase [Candidatus Heimdallarchaeota archaeon]
MVIPPHLLPDKTILDAVELKLQTQPAGIDLTLKAIEEIISPGYLGAGKTRNLSETRKIKPSSELPSYSLEPGKYIIRYNEIITVPDGAIALVLPRSSLMRCGATLETAVWDPGYSGRGMGLLIVGHTLQLDVDARVGQLIFIQMTDKSISGYNGTFQNEGK